MLAALVALLTLPLTAATPSPAGVVSLAGCTAGEAAGCQPEQDRARTTVRVGKRCHPDPTKSKSCREVLIEQKAPKEAALAEAR